MNTSSSLRVLGIDLGSAFHTSAVIGSGGGIDVLTSETGERQLAAAVTFTDRDRLICDSIAPTTHSWKTTITGAKNLLGFSDTPRFQEVFANETQYIVASSLPTLDDGIAQYNLPQALLRPEQVVAAQLAKIRQSADKA
eukprot:376115_1